LAAVAATGAAMAWRATSEPDQAFGVHSIVKVFLALANSKLGTGEPAESTSAVLHKETTETKFTVVLATPGVPAFEERSPVYVKSHGVVVLGTDYAAMHVHL